MSFNSTLAKYTLGLLQLNELPSLAAEAIQTGQDSPSLRLLAATDEHDLEEIRRLFFRSVNELGLSLPSATEAGLMLAKSIARQVLRGTITPYEGGKRIWGQVYIRIPELEQLTPFVGLASEYEDDVEHRDEYSRLLREKCADLVRDEET